LVIVACKPKTGRMVSQQLGRRCTRYHFGSRQASRNRGTVLGSRPPIVPICSPRLRVRRRDTFPARPFHRRAGRLCIAGQCDLSRTSGTRAHCTSTPDSCRRVRAGQRLASLCFRHSPSPHKAGCDIETGRTGCFRLCLRRRDFPISRGEILPPYLAEASSLLCVLVVFVSVSYFQSRQPNNVPDLTPIVALTSAFAVHVVNAG
jgi:hypothetical protein